MGFIFTAPKLTRGRGTWNSQRTVKNRLKGSDEITLSTVAARMASHHALQKNLPTPTRKFGKNLFAFRELLKPVLPFLQNSVSQYPPPPRTRPIRGWFLWYIKIYIYIYKMHGCYGTWFQLLSCSFPTFFQDSEGDEGSVITSSKKPSKSCFRPSKSGCLGFCGVRGKGLRFVKVNFQVYKNINYANYTVLREYSTSYLSLKAR